MSVLVCDRFVKVVCSIHFTYTLQIKISTLLLVGVRTNGHALCLGSFCIQNIAVSECLH